MNHKPMLAVDCGPVESLVFPLIASPKLDGVRCVISKNGALARSLKPIPNQHAQNMLSGLPVGLDGELLVGEATAPDVYRKTVSVVMSSTKDTKGLVFHVFDFQVDRPFTERQKLLRTLLLECPVTVALVPQVTVYGLAQLLELELEWVGVGYEGAILRKPDSPYKHGRSGLKEGFLLKLKRFADGEAEVIGVTELMHNGNTAMTNELGRTARSHKKEGMTGAGVMGTLVVRDTKTGVEFEIGTGFSAAERRDLWADWQEANEQTRASCDLVKYKHFPSGAKDKPRHPVFLGWRDKRDV